MKKLFSVALVLVATMFANTTFAQNITGKVLDELNQPFPYVNVLLQKADSSYIAGTITAEDGTFTLKSTPDGKLLNLSFVGYKTICKEVTSENMGDIQLLPDDLLLSEVVVKAELPKPEYKGDALVTSIQGTMLEKAGTAENLLDKIPNVTAQDGNVVVFGRGTPEIYINGRKMRDASELEQLTSDQVKYVEVVSNPGARYDASVKAVIRIYTKKIAGEGFGIDNRAVATHREKYGMSYYDQFNFNYRKNGFDLSGMLYAGKFRNGNDQTFVTDTYLSEHWQQEMDLTDQTSDANNVEATLTLNYQVNGNHTFGGRYNFERYPESHWYVNQYANTYCNDVLQESLYSYLADNEPETYHRSNLYYSGKIKGWSLDFNADGLWSDAENTQTAEEKITGGITGNPNRSVTTIDTKKNELYAAKLVASHPFAKGNLSFGAEYSHNNRNTTYFNAEGIIENDQAQIKEGATSAFVEYARQFGNLQMQAGLRYENVGFNYYDSGKHMKEQSKNYNNVFPSISFSFPIKDVQIMLGYTNDISRPSYWNLRSNITYVNRYMYDKGNPFLMPSLSHNVTLGASYKWINLYVGYSHIMDEMINQTVAWSEDDPTIALLTLVNSPEYDKLVASLNLSPTIGVWTPQLGLALQQQWYNANTPVGVEKFNKPVGSITLMNNFNLPGGFIFDIAGDLTTKGHSTNAYMNEARFDIGASLYKSFLKERLILQLRANNLLESKQNITLYSGIRVLQQTQVFHRQISLTLRYKFNTTKSKYKGTGAGESQKNRM